VKLHALPLSPPPPPVPPPRVPSSATATLPFQPQQAINSVQPAAIRRSPTETRGNTATQAKQTSRVATPILDASDTKNLQAPYRRGALLDISA
jgi:hypothetical protein